MPGKLGWEDPWLEITRKPITFRLAKKNQSESYIYWREGGGTLCRLLKELFGAFKVYFFIVTFPVLRIRFVLQFQTASLLVRTRIAGIKRTFHQENGGSICGSSWEGRSRKRTTREAIEKCDTEQQRLLEQLSSKLDSTDPVPPKANRKRRRKIPVPQPCHVSISRVFLSRFVIIYDYDCDLHHEYECLCCFGSNIHSFLWSVINFDIYNVPGDLSFLIFSTI